MNPWLLILPLNTLDLFWSEEMAPKPSRWSLLRSPKLSQRSRSAVLDRDLYHLCILQLLSQEPTPKILRVKTQTRNFTLHDDGKDAKRKQEMVRSTMLLRRDGGMRMIIP